MLLGELVGGGAIDRPKNTSIYLDLIGEVPGDSRYLIRFVATDNDKGILVVLRKGINELSVHLLPISILPDEKGGI